MAWMNMMPIVELVKTHYFLPRDKYQSVLLYYFSLIVISKSHLDTVGPMALDPRDGSLPEISGIPVFADPPLEPSVLTLDNWMLLS